MAYYVVYNPETDAIAWRAEGDPAIQVLPEPLIAVPVPAEALVSGDLDLAVVRDHYCARIDAEAEQVRSRFATPGSGQAMEYQEAVRQAQALSDGKPGPWPMLAADVAAGTIDPRTDTAVATDAAAADLVLWMHGQWVALGAAIREARLSAKVAIRAGATLGAILTASAVDWEALTEA